MTRVRACKVGWCSALISDPSGYCERHKSQQVSTRPSTGERGYDARWRKVREAWLSENPLCARCEERNVITLADLVDHIVPISAGGGVLDWKNLQSLCNTCHAIKTQEDLKKYGPVKWRK